MTKNDRNAAGQFAANQWARRSRRFSSILLNDACSAGSSGQVVTMMQTAKPRHRYDSATGFGTLLCLTTGWCSLLQREVRPVIVVVADVFAQESHQMPFVEYDHMVEQIAAATPHPAFGNAILPRTTKRRSLRLNTEVLDCAANFRIEIRAAIKNKIAGGRVIRKRLAHLLHNPRAAGMPGHIAVQNPPSIMRDDKEAVENTECQSRHREKTIAAMASR